MKLPKRTKGGGPSRGSGDTPSPADSRGGGAAAAGFAISGKAGSETSPLNDRVWHWILVVAGGSLGIWILHRLAPLDDPLPALLAGVTAVLIWAAAVRLLMFDARWRWFWGIWLLLGFALIPAFPAVTGLWLAAASFSFLFLLFRKYRPYAHLTSRRRVALSLLAFILFGLLIVGMLSTQDEVLRIDLSEGETAAVMTPPLSESLGRSLFNYGMSSLEAFWFFSLFHLFFRIRLHFLRLRPKLAVSAVLLVLVPLLLVMVMGLLTLYGTLGESRAIRASNLLLDWSELAVGEEGFLATLSRDSLVYREPRALRGGGGEPPDWAPGLCAALRSADPDFLKWDTEKTGGYVRIQDDLWLTVVRGYGTPEMEIQTSRLDRRVMDRLARILHSDIRISFTDTLTMSDRGEREIQTVQVRSGGNFTGVSGRMRPDVPEHEVSGVARETPSWWKRRLYFGVSSLSIYRYEARLITKETVLVLLESSLEDIAGELAASRNPLSQMVLVLLLVMAALLLILEMFALIFGIRITSGITSAVRALHRGTRAIARGDLDTRIEIPNEDELGDLAASFNEMAAAVKKGKEEAVARERLESELETARKIQEKLLPHVMPDVPGFEIAGTSLPSQQVGGDYFDFLDMADGHMGIAIADVSGKGIPAALLMANLQASLHAQVIKPGEVAEITARINDLLVESTDANMFATFFYGILNRNTAAFTSTNAGHNPPILLRKAGGVERLEAGGLLLGFMPRQSYVQQRVVLGPGDVLILFTDGITEAVDTELGAMTGNMFGEERLIELIRTHRDRPARDIQAAILAAISGHTGNSPQSDDITLVVIKRQDPEVQGADHETKP